MLKFNTLFIRIKRRILASICLCLFHLLLLTSFSLNTKVYSLKQFLSRFCFNIFFNVGCSFINISSVFQCDHLDFYRAVILHSLKRRIFHLHIWINASRFMAVSNEWSKIWSNYRYNIYFPYLFDMFTKNSDNYQINNVKSLHSSPNVW